MSYTNWESMKRLFNDEEDFEFFMRLDDTTKDKVTSLLPFPIKEASEIGYGFRDGFENTLHSAVWTLKIIQDVIENPLPIEITELPDRANFMACYSDSYNSETKCFGFSVAVSAKDLLKFYTDGKRDKLYCVAINPNIARLCKLLYGSEINGDVNQYLMYGWFLGHLTDNHTSLYKKNMGEPYKGSHFSDEEKQASSDWLTRELHSDISNSVSYLAPYTNNILGDVFSIVSVFRVVELIREIEDNQHHYCGYQYRLEPDFYYEKTDTSMMLHDFLKTNYSEFSKYLISRLKDKSRLEVRILHSLMFWQFGKASIANRIESSLTELSIKEGFESVIKLGLPENFNYIVYAYNLSIGELVNAIPVIKKESPIAIGVDKSSLSKDFGKYNEDLLLYKSGDNVYNAYLVTSPIIKLTTISKVIQKKLGLTCSQILRYAHYYKGELKDELLGEASLIHYLFEGGMTDRFTFLNKFNSVDHYKEMMLKHNLPIGKLVEMI